MFEFQNVDTLTLASSSVSVVLCPVFVVKEQSWWYSEVKYMTFSPLLNYLAFLE